MNRIEKAILMLYPLFSLSVEHHDIERDIQRNICREMFESWWDQGRKKYRIGVR